jgi:hypothetical protein
MRRMKMNDTRTVLQKAQDFALGQVLSEWDSTFDYDHILLVLRSDEYEAGYDTLRESVVPWMPYENDSGSDVADTIERMASDLVSLFGDTTSIDVSKCEAKAGDEDSFSNLDT